MSVTARGISDVGCVRHSNEDSIGLFSELKLYIVADGMGGHAAGEVASHLAVEQIAHYVGLSVEARNTHQNEAQTQKSEEPLAYAISYANRHIFSKSEKDAALAGMGTTVVAVLALEKEVIIGFVGDSRVYLHQNGSVYQLTHDHSLVNQYVEKGFISPEAAATHPQKHVLSRALGTSLEVEVETFKRSPVPGDIYLLCSDGLSNKLSASDLNTLILETEGGLDAIGNKMLQLAKDRGGEDNISLILVAYPCAER